MSKRLFWLTQRYVFPVMAETEKEALEIAFRARAKIADECGPVAEGLHKNTILLPQEREGWGDCVPYGENEWRTVDEIEGLK